MTRKRRLAKHVVYSSPSECMASDASPAPYTYINNRINKPFYFLITKLNRRYEIMKKKKYHPFESIKLFTFFVPSKQTCFENIVRRPTIACHAEDGHTRQENRRVLWIPMGPPPLLF